MGWGSACAHAEAQKGESRVFGKIISGVGLL